MATRRRRPGMGWTSLLEVALAVGGGIVLTLGGMALEVLAAQQVMAGSVLTGGWLVALGAIVLVAGVTLLRGNGLDALRA